jgi:hypothetical protein
MTDNNICSAEDLIEKIVANIASCNPERVLIQAGHFPIVPRDTETVESTEFWNDFTEHTFDIGCAIAARVPNSRLAVVCDDHNYFGSQSRAITLKGKQFRRNLYINASGDNPVLPRVFEDILTKYNLNHSRLISQDHNKTGREKCRIISENILIRDALRNGAVESSNCGKAYRAFLSDVEMFDVSKDYLVSLIPSPCFQNVCNDVLKKKSLNATHAFYMLDLDYAAYTGNMETFYPNKIVVREDAI